MMLAMFVEVPESYLSSVELFSIVVGINGTFRSTRIFKFAEHFDALKRLGCLSASFTRVDWLFEMIFRMVFSHTIKM